MQRLPFRTGPALVSPGPASLINSSVIGSLGLDCHSGPFALSPNKWVVRRDYCQPLVSLVF
jgi:hypothetical protein